MKKLLVIAALGVTVAFAAEAWSAPSPTPIEKKLQRDVAALKTQVTSLQKSVSAIKKEDTALEAGIGVSIVLWFCGISVTADDLQGTWQEVDQLSAATQTGKTYFGPQLPVSDSLGTTPSVCQEIGVPRSQALPPSTAQITALLAILQRAGSASSSSSLRAVAHAASRLAVAR